MIYIPPFSAGIPASAQVARTHSPPNTPPTIRGPQRFTRNCFSNTVGTSWRVDETYISIKAKCHYLYRAVDKHGKTVDFLLRRDRGIAAAQAFFRKALGSNSRACRAR